MFRIALTISMMFSLPAFAVRSGGGGPGGKQGNPACAPVRDACEKAGYKRGAGGGTAGQTGSPGTLRDCMQKWSSGGSIPGLTIKNTDASGKECAAHMAKMKERGGGRRGGPGGQMGGQVGPGGRRGGPGAGGNPNYAGKPGAMGNGGSAPRMNKPSPLLNTRPTTPMNSAPAILPPKPAAPAATPPPKKP